MQPPATAALGAIAGPMAAPERTRGPRPPTYERELDRQQRSYHPRRRWRPPAGRCHRSQGLHHRSRDGGGYSHSWATRGIWRYALERSLALFLNRFQAPWPARPPGVDLYLRSRGRARYVPEERNTNAPRRLAPQLTATFQVQAPPTL